MQRYITKKSSEKKWEAHRVFGDIQVVFQGEEVCGHTDVKKLQSAEAYSHEKDVEKFTAPDFTASKLVLRKGTFTIFYPGDAHQPGVILNEPTAVLKVVIKFKL